MNAWKLTLVFLAFAAVTVALLVVFNQGGDHTANPQASMALMNTDSSAAFHSRTGSPRANALNPGDTTVPGRAEKAETQSLPLAGHIDTKNVTPDQVLAFAKTLIGVPYRYGSTDPKQGFDCSGFITYVFNHFGVQVPRSSVEFTNVERSVPIEASRPGDLILFTGTDSSNRIVGHMGIIVSNNKGSVEFIHSTSGKAYGVTISPFSDYYKGRYLKTIRIFP
ncbi:MAG TPA: C40 family peptidase [Flavisolibacter sp.]|jgi:cell wall-associated NlpC family hydrolase